MWECNYGKEPLDIRLLVLRFLRKSPLILAAALLGALCVGGPYFLVKVTFGPAREYEAVTDFYIDYALQETGEEYTYFNQTTWTQLITDDVFTDKILTYMSGMELPAEGDDSREAASQDAGEWSGPLSDVEKAAGITKRELRGYLYATMLSDTRIVTTTVTTNDPELTMRIEKALLRAMADFGEEQKEIAGVRILQEPAEASPVTADVRTFRACMLGAVIFVFVTVFYLLIYFVLDEGISVPVTFERRCGVPMLGTIHSGELSVLAEKLFSEGETFCKPVLVTADEKVDLGQVRKALSERGISAGEDDGLNRMLGGIYRKVSAGAEEKGAGAGRKEAERQSEASAVKYPKTVPDKGAEETLCKPCGNRKLLLAVKAGVHNGKRIEKLLDFCRKCDLEVTAALLWEADETLIRAYEMPEHVLSVWKRLMKGGQN